MFQTRWGAQKNIKNIKGYDFKNAPKPEKYDNNPAEYEDWKVLFEASLLAIDVRWDKALSAFNDDKPLKSHDRSKSLIDDSEIAADE